MAAHVVILIDSNPAASPRPAEALRIATGLAIGRSTRVSVCIAGPAARTWRTELADDFSGWLDGDQVKHYWPGFLEAGGEIWVHGRAEDASLAGESRRVDSAELAILVAQAGSLMRF